MCSVFVAALIGANVYLYMQLDKVKKDLTAANDTAQSRIDKLEEAASVSTRSNRRTVEELRDQLERARRQANLAAGQAKDEALKKVDETRAALEAAQQKASQQLSSDISKVKESADTQFSQVGTEVTTVKGDVAATKSQLEKTVADLKRATGELDGHSVLIATNGKELAALQALGERNYVQFTIRKKQATAKSGGRPDPVEEGRSQEEPLYHRANRRRQDGGEERSRHQRAVAVHDLESQAALRAGGQRREEGHHRRIFVDSESAEHQKLAGHFGVNSPSIICWCGRACSVRT